MAPQHTLAELEEDRRALGQTEVRGRDARVPPFLLLQSTTTVSRSPQVLIGAIDLGTRLLPDTHQGARALSVPLRRSGQAARGAA